MRNFVESHRVASPGCEISGRAVAVLLMTTFPGLLKPLNGQPADMSDDFEVSASWTYGLIFRCALQLMADKSAEQLATYTPKEADLDPATPSPPKRRKTAFAPSLSKGAHPQMMMHHSRTFSKPRKLVKILAHADGQFDRMVRKEDDHSKLKAMKTDQDDGERVVLEKEIVDLEDADCCSVDLLKPGEVAMPISSAEQADPIRHLEKYFTCWKLRKNVFRIAAALQHRQIEAKFGGARYPTALALSALLDPHFIVSPHVTKIFQSNYTWESNDKVEYRGRRAAELQTLLLIREYNPNQRHFFVDYTNAIEHCVNGLSNIFQKNTPPFAFIESVIDHSNLFDYLTFASTIYKALLDARSHPSEDVRTRAKLITPAFALMLSRLTRLHYQTISSAIGAPLRMESFSED